MYIYNSNYNAKYFIFFFRIIKNILSYQQPLLFIYIYKMISLFQLNFYMVQKYHN